MSNDIYGKEWQQEAVFKSHLINAKSVKPEPIRWLWTNYLAKGKLHILGGMAGTGKTTLALGIASTITTAGRFPDGQKCQSKGSILIWSAEDDPKDTIVPRLYAAGAEVEKVYIIQGRINCLTQEIEPFDPAIDIHLLIEAAQEIGDVQLMILDPVVSAVKGDMHKANDVRRSLQPLVDFANKIDCAILGITHFSKGTGGNNPLERVTGSQAFGALPRVVMVAAKEQDGQTRVLAIAKSNIGSDSGGVTYHLEQAELNNGVMASRVLWGEVLEGNAKDILGDIEQEEDQRENNEPAEVLEMILAEGKMDSKEVKKVMLNNGFSDKQTRLARSKLNIQITKEGFGKDIKTYWGLPIDAHKSPYMPSKNMGIYGEKGIYGDKKTIIDEEKNNHSEPENNKKDDPQNDLFNNDDYEVFE